MVTFPAIANKFLVNGEYVEAIPFGSGHINDTYHVVCREAGHPVSYVFQRINRQVFPNPVAVMENIERVTTHLQRKLERNDDHQQALRLVPARDGRTFCIDETGEFWRAYQFIAGARTYDTVQSIEQAYQAARAFGHFQQLLADLPPPRLHEIIPDFHHTPKRFAAFQQAVDADACDRVRSVGPEIDFAHKRESLTRTLLEAGLPERITHNDTKFNNVMLDDASGEGVCIVDLDTVMPGLALYDFGDMVRTTTCLAAEDEQDLDQVQAQLPLFDALVGGYLSSAGTFLTADEKRLLAISGRVITFEIGLRFLTDYLSGDTYFKIHRPAHNLDRCRTQFRLVASLEEQETALEDLVRQRT